MKALFVGVFFLALHYSSGFVVKAKQSSESELVAVAVLYRHGDKTPTTSFPNDQYFDLSYWPMGFGQLTNNGKKRHYELGKWFRKRYASFLPEEYNAKDIYVFSSDVDRTLMSAQVNLAGLYPPKGAQVWNENLLWQPIPVHTMPKKEDQILYMERPCPKYKRLYNETYKSDFFTKIDEKYADFYKEVSTLTGWEIDDVHYFAQLQSVLYVYTNHNSTYLPPWSSSMDQDKLNYLAGLNYARYTFTEDLKRLGDGPFFDNLFTKLDKVLDPAQAAPKFLMLSAHESTLSSVLNGMGVFDNRAPEFASCVIWEVKKDTGGDHYVNLFYKKNSSDALDQLQLDGCDMDCKYESFKKTLSPITLDLKSWDDECVRSD
ncbi:prostatic acid phosphatase-like [Anoplophora glabripennis]|uniref:prostatic acid phosphatase-like n=1 Tax=Anoplophora glabripennis TaxID=217634 RepID=UPI000873CF3F|nr:prostatic acid phosphatase-like [Anoplophora glabripennis]